MKIITIVLLALIKLLELLLFVRIICSWIPGVERYEWFKPLYQVTEPMLAPFRRIIPPIGGMIDISPIAVFLLLQFLSFLISGGHF